MESKIKIEIDFNKGNQPVIEIQSKGSEDVRDALIASFIQSLGHTSRWARMEYQNEMTNGASRWYLRPLTPEDLKEEIKLMGAVLKEAF